MTNKGTHVRGFTLIELLIVIAIVGLLLTIVLVVLTTARNKGNDGAVKSNLRNAISQGEVFFNTNTAANSTYTSVCTNPGPVGGANTVATLVTAAAKASGLSSYGINNVPAASTAVATCNDSANAWAVEVPLKNAGANQMWCVDSGGKSKQTGTSIGATTACP